MRRMGIDEKPGGLIPTLARALSLPEEVQREGDGRGGRLKLCGQDDDVCDPRGLRTWQKRNGLPCK